MTVPRARIIESESAVSLIEPGRQPVGNDSLAPAARVVTLYRIQTSNSSSSLTRLPVSRNGKRPIHWNLNRGLGIVTVTVTSTASENRDL